MNNFTPHPYQQRITERLCSHPKTFCDVGMGLGKTAATLQALTTLFEECMISKVLVIAPLRVAKHVWPDEIKKWGFYLTHACVLGTQKDRLQALCQQVDIHIINRENVPWLVRSGPFIWDCVIIDESSSFKNQASLRFKALRRVIKKANRVILLTGTPAPNSLLELWPQVFLLDQGERLGTAYTRFRKKYFEEDYSGYNWEIRPEAEEKIFKKISDLMISMRSEDYLDLPERIDVDVTVDLEPDVLSKIKELEKQFLIELNGQDIEAVNSAVLAGKLLQAASGAIYDENGDDQWLHNEKLEALEEILEECQGENVLIAYGYRHDAERIKAMFPSIVDIKEKGVIERWGKKQVPLMMGHPASAGHGLNLQDGGHIVVWFSLTWSLELWLQFNKRIHRQGQTKPVRVFRIIANSTIDSYVLQKLDKKKKGQDALKEYFSEEKKKKA